MPFHTANVWIHRRKDKIMIQKLIQKIQKTHAPIVVGLDPMLSYVPAHIQKRAFEEHGETLEGAAEAIWQYNKEIVDHVYDLIPFLLKKHSKVSSHRKNWYVRQHTATVPTVIRSVLQPDMSKKSIIRITLQREWRSELLWVPLRVKM